MGNHHHCGCVISFEFLDYVQRHSFFSKKLKGELRDDLIADVLREQPSLDTAADQLVAAANRAGGTDNITVLLVQ